MKLLIRQLQLSDMFEGLSLIMKSAVVDAFPPKSSSAPPELLSLSKDEEHHSNSKKLSIC